MGRSSSSLRGERASRATSSNAEVAAGVCYGLLVPACYLHLTIWPRLTPVPCSLLLSGALTTPERLNVEPHMAALSAEINTDK